MQSGDVFADFYDASNTGIFRLFTYDGRGELTGDIGHLGTSVADQSKPLHGRRYEYDYDNAGNRRWSNRTGVSDLRDDYTTNALNQYVTRENNTLPVSGTAAPDAGGAGGTAVAVTGGTLSPVAAGRQGRYWNDDLTVNNNANPGDPNPWRGPLTVFTARRGTGGGADVFKVEARMAELAARVQTFSYDLDGNLTSDGMVDYTWDAENRLIRMETNSVAATWGFPKRVLEFRYDYLGRRVQKRVLDSDPNPAVEISCRRYLYDGWNLVAEFAFNSQLSTLSLLRSYTWGLDIARSLTDAGGVGALLQIADHPSGKTYLPAYDGNGNIMAVLNADSGALAAAYEYSPYGEPLRAQTYDVTVSDQPFRFSTKFTDVETGLVYYGKRYYSPSQGRFLGRDPIEESGGLNLYGFCLNNPVNKWDVLGMSIWDIVRNWFKDSGSKGGKNDAYGPAVMMDRFEVRESRYDGRSGSSTNLDLLEREPGGVGGSAPNSGVTGEVYGRDPNNGTLVAGGDPIMMQRFVVNLPPVKEGSGAEQLSTIIAAVEGAGQGFLAYVDGFNPVGDPFAAAGAYDANDPSMQLGRLYGGTGLMAVSTISGAGWAARLFSASGQSFQSLSLGEQLMTAVLIRGTIVQAAAGGSFVGQVGLAGLLGLQVYGSAQTALQFVEYVSDDPNDGG